MASTVTPTTTPAPPTLTQKLSVEALGTAVLVLIGCGVAVVSGGDLVATGLAFGLTLMVLIYAFGRVSGGHFNPAVSVGAALGGRISWRDAGTYAAAQVIGGIVGAIVLTVLMLGLEGFELYDSSLGANGYDAEGFDYAIWAAPLAELVMTAIFVLVILAVTDTRNEHPGLAPLAIGFTLVVIHFALIPLTGTSVNPARSIGPAFLSGTDWIIELWPFILGPLLGGALAGFAYPALFGRDADPVPGSGLNRAPKPAQGAYGAPDQFQQQWNQPVAGGYAGDAGYGQPAAYTPPVQQTPTGQTGQVPVTGQTGQTGQHAQAGAHAGAHTSGHTGGQQAAEQPIIQDGWQWDPQAQQWIPAQQQPPAGTQGGQAGQGGQGGWAAPGAGEQTQVRPTDGF